jgi:GDPmannose 4,6-dehydratase
VREMGKMKTALVTGISGQDGYYLAELLLKKGYRVVGMVRRTSGAWRPAQQGIVPGLVDRVEFVHGDLMDQTSLNRVVESCQPDEIYNLAAQSVPRNSWQLPLYTADVTGIGAQRMLEAALQFAPQARFYQASSSEIFGHQQRKVLNETSPLRPNNPYGVAKAYAHQIVAVYRATYDFHASSGILFNHESPFRSPDFLTRKVSLAAACISTGVRSVPTNEDGEPLVVNRKVRIGNLDTHRDWGFAGDYVSAMWLMLQQDVPDDYVVGTGSLKTVRDCCQVAFSHVGLNWEDHVVVDKQFERPTEISPIAADSAKARRVLEWEPKVGFDALIKMMVDEDVKTH